MVMQPDKTTQKPLFMLAVLRAGRAKNKRMTADASNAAGYKPYANTCRLATRFLVQVATSAAMVSCVKRTSFGMRVVSMPQAHRA